MIALFEELLDPIDRDVGEFVASDVEQGVFAGKVCMEVVDDKEEDVVDGGAHFVERKRVSVCSLCGLTKLSVFE